MRKLLFLILLLYSSLTFAQDYSIIHFVGKKSWKEPTYSLYLNDRLIGSLSEHENLDYKIYSTGNLTIRALHEYGRKTLSLSVESGKEYYIALRTANISQTTMELLPEKEGEKEYLQNEIVTKLEEDVNNPLPNLTHVDIPQRPKQGTAFLINDEGYLVTNFHVIEGASEIKIVGIKGDFNTAFDAIVVSVDRLTDLALLKVESKLFSFSAPPYVLNQSKSMNKAEEVFALGYPIENSLGREVKITNGIINSLTGFKSSISEFQISAAIQGGNSGGPLFNTNGEIIGVVSAKIASDKIDQVGYAIKSDYLKFFLEQSGQTTFNESDNSLRGMKLTEQVKLISNYVYIVNTE